jgi:hypothetical protein
MKLFKKSTLSLALTAAMIGGVAMTQQATAMPAGSAGDAQPAVGAGEPYVNPNGLGQALVFPYYTVRTGFKSFFNVTNTSDETVAVKVRFHEGQNSRDALDFNVVLSPEDVWTGWVEDSASGPVVKTVDNSCVVGAPNIKGSGQALSNVAYGDIIPTFEDQGPNDINRTREGYVEVIAMGKTNTSTQGAAMAAAALHNAAGMPANCSYVDTAFVAAASAPTTLPVSFPFADNDANGDGDAPAVLAFDALDVGENPLKGNFSIIDALTGRGAGNAAVAIADFMNTAVVAATPSGNLVTAQNFPYFLEPSLASRDGIWSVGATGTAGLDLVEAALSSTTIINEWANNPATGAAVDWAVTFPTKGFRVDNENAAGVVTATNIQASNNQWRYGTSGSVAADAGLSIAAGPFVQNIDANGAAITIGITGYDREEKGEVATTGNTNPSPFPPGGVTALTLQGEANLVTFGSESALSGENFVLDFDVAATLGNNAPNGWSQLNFTDGDATKMLPVVGYAFKSRNQGDATLSFSQILGHAWK